MTSKSLLIELGTEELPPKALKTLASSFANTIDESLKDAGVVARDNHSVRFFAAPRRLAVRIEEVSANQADRIEQRKGPSVAAAFDVNGEPTKAVLGFARSCGVEVDALERVSTDKGEWLAFEQKIAGEPIEQLVNQALESAIRQLPIPKRMRWGNNDQEFVRPVHWLVVLRGETVLPVSVLGLHSGNTTLGHRFHAPEELLVTSADDYEQVLLEQGHVHVDYTSRQQLIQQQIEKLVEGTGIRAVVEQSLLDEVTGLVEWPVALKGEFDQQFLDVPAEVLVSSMSDHQKYFHLTDKAGNLLPGFITISNIESSDPARVTAGNERVLRARLSDAEFFWLGDQKSTLESRMPQLDRLLFHKKLGSVSDKVHRITGIAREIANQLGVDDKEVQRACQLCKTDLVTDMVGEFPELQGTIGRYYAINQGESAAVSAAIEQHYQPRFAGDELPGSDLSRCLAIADRVDSLTGIFGCGEVPTGDKDPFALRRSALGVLRILIECELDIDLQALINIGVKQHENASVKVAEGTSVKVFDFVIERLRAYYQPMGFDNETINAVMAVRPVKPLDFDRRLRALAKFASDQSSAALSLAAANKRIANILAKQGDGVDRNIDESLFVLDPEKVLHRQLVTQRDQAHAAFNIGNYSDGLAGLANLKAPIDDFFDQVMVMDEDVAIRNNRLALLNGLRLLFLEVADVSLMKVESS